VKKIVFQNRKKCSSKILLNTLELTKKIGFSGLHPLGARIPPNLFRGGEIASKCHNSQTTHRRDLVFGSKLAELPCFYKRLELFLYLYHKKVTIGKSIFSTYSQEKLVKTCFFADILCFRI